jgi:DNA-directed RNA polymerase specialized sigma24 family protein
MMLQVARAHVSADTSAQEVVQDTWLAMIRGLDTFEGRSSLRTWVLAIIGNQRAGNQRVLLHRGRSRLRALLELRYAADARVTGS